MFYWYLLVVNRKGIRMFSYLIGSELVFRLFKFEDEYELFVHKKERPLKTEIDHCSDKSLSVLESYIKENYFENKFDWKSLPEICKKIEFDYVFNDIHNGSPNLKMTRDDMGGEIFLSIKKFGDDVRLDVSGSKEGLLYLAKVFAISAEQSKCEDVCVDERSSICISPPDANINCVIHSHNAFSDLIEDAKENYFKEDITYSVIQNGI